MKKDDMAALRPPGAGRLNPDQATGLFATCGFSMLSISKTIYRRGSSRGTVRIVGKRSK